MYTDHFDFNFVVTVGEILEGLEKVILGLPRVLPFGYQQTHADLALDRRGLERVVDDRPVLDLGRVNCQREVVHHRDVNELLSLFDTVDQAVDVVRTTLRRELRWGALKS